MIDGAVSIVLGVWVLLIGLGKARVSKNPESGAAWLRNWGLAFRIGGSMMVLVGIAKIVTDLAR